jgi:DNA polymerase III epsilon subunit-like protein
MDLQVLEEIFNRFFQKYPTYGNLLGLDLETTGFASNAKIIEIGSIAVINDFGGVRFELFSSLINPGELISDKITEVTKIANSELQVAPGETSVYPDFEKWFNSLPPIETCIAHNASFDRSKLLNNLTRMNSSLVDKIPPFECTMKLSRQRLKGPANDQLKTLCEYFGFQNRQAHRALADTEACLYVYAKIMLGEYSE